MGRSLGVCGGGPSSFMGAGSGPPLPLVKGSGGLCSPFLGCGGKPSLLLVVMVLVGPCHRWWGVVMGPRRRSCRHLVVACRSLFSCHVILAVVVAIDEAMVARWRGRDGGDGDSGDGGDGGDGGEEAMVGTW